MTINLVCITQSVGKKLHSAQLLIVHIVNTVPTYWSTILPVLATMRFFMPDVS